MNLYRVRVAKKFDMNHPHDEVLFVATSFQDAEKKARKYCRSFGYGLVIYSIAYDKAVRS